MNVIYEWGVEEVDVHGEIVGHWHADTLKEVMAYAKDIPIQLKPSIVLIREVWDGDSLEDRTWAYPSEDGLPTCFGSGVAVPKRFHKEYSLS